MRLVFLKQLPISRSNIEHVQKIAVKHRKNIPMKIVRCIRPKSNGKKTFECSKTGHFNDFNLWIHSKSNKNAERGNSTADFSDTFGLFFFNLFPIGNDIK